MKDRLYELAYPNFGPDKLGDAINSHEVAEAFWNEFEKASKSHGHYESTWAALRTALRVIEQQGARGNE